MKLLSVCVGEAKERPGKKMKTGIHKHPTGNSVVVGFAGIKDDAICNLKYHGGSEQAIYVEGNLTRLWWEEETKKPIPYGLFGENLCFEGLDNRTVAAGDRFICGDVTMEVTAPRMPCRIFSEKMDDTLFAKRYIKAGRPGFYCRVIAPGRIKAGNPVEYEPFKGKRILMPEMMSHHGKKVSTELIERYRNVPAHSKLLASLAGGFVKF